MDLSVSRQQTTFQVKQRYFTLLQRIEQFDLAKEQVSGFGGRACGAKKRCMKSAPARSRTFLSAESQLAGDRVALIARENDVAIARAQLGFSLGLSPDVNISPTEKTFSVSPPPITYRESLERAEKGSPRSCRNDTECSRAGMR